jgi:mRNA-degrading endonuclease YafQ of YafQ-DinJ toxin-antitoxin module
MFKTKELRYVLAGIWNTLKLLEANPHHPSLRLHALKGKLHGLHSVSINISYRITLEFILKDEEIILINVGDHDQVY